MAHTQKPDFVFRRNGRVHLNRQGASVQSTTGSRGVRISGSNAGYTMFRGSVKMLIKKVQLDATVCRHLFTARSLYMFRASQHPSSASSWTFLLTLNHDARNHEFQEVVWRVLQPTPFATFPFTSLPVRHRVPSRFSWTLLTWAPQRTKGRGWSCRQPSSPGWFLKYQNWDLPNRSDGLLPC